MTEVGALIAPEYRPAFGSRPVFEQPRGIPREYWVLAVGHTSESDQQGIRMTELAASIIGLSVLLAIIAMVNDE